MMLLGNISSILTFNLAILHFDLLSFLDNDKSVMFGKSVRHNETHKNNHLDHRNDKYDTISSFVRGAVTVCRFCAGNANRLCQICHPPKM